MDERMTTEPVLRLASTNELADLSAIMSDCLQHYFGSSEGGHEAALRTLEPSPKSVEAAIAYVGSTPAGFATFAVVYPGPEGRGTLYMKDLFVSANARSQNLGRKLMMYLATIAVERNCIRFDWTAETSNPKALAFYYRLGASRVEEKVYFRLQGDALTDFLSER